MPSYFQPRRLGLKPQEAGLRHRTFIETCIFATPLMCFTAVEIADDPVEETQKIVHFFIAIQFFRFRLGQARFLVLVYKGFNTVLNMRRCLYNRYPLIQFEM